MDLFILVMTLDAKVMAHGKPGIDIDLPANSKTRIIVHVTSSGKVGGGPGQGGSGGSGGSGGTGGNPGSGATSQVRTEVMLPVQVQVTVVQHLMITLWVKEGGMP
jgi:hypothetical protein